MALRLGRWKFPWAEGKPGDGDPYWDFFINTPPADRANSVIQMIREAPEGNIFPTKADIHTPEITSSHVKALARYLGTDLVGIAKLNEKDQAGDYPFAVVCAVRANYDPGKARGIGGQVPVQKGLFITFVLSAWIRELGFRATASPSPDAERLAAAAGLGSIDSKGKLATAELGTGVYVADIIRTDMPLAPDG